MKNLEGRDVLTLADFTAEEILTFLDNADQLKMKLYRREPHKLLSEKTLAMIFAATSTRTRVSFETAMTQLGGHAQYLSVPTMQAARGETIKETAQVLSRYVDGVMIRHYEWRHEGIVEFAEWATVPVISSASWRAHPCQGLADLQTIREKKGGLRGVKLAICWACCTSRNKPPSYILDTLFAGARLGMEIVLAYPEGYDPYEEDVMQKAKEEADLSGGSIDVVRDRYDAVAGADVINTKGWIPVARQPDETFPHNANPEKYKEWIVDADLVRHAREDVIVMHAMPAYRGEELTDEVMDGPHSVLIDEAENRLHAQKGVLSLVMG